MILKLDTYVFDMPQVQELVYRSLPFLPFASYTIRKCQRSQQINNHLDYSLSILLLLHSFLSVLQGTRIMGVNQSSLMMHYSYHVDWAIGRSLVSNDGCYGYIKKRIVARKTEEGTRWGVVSEEKEELV